MRTKKKSRPVVYAVEGCESRVLLSTVPAGFTETQLAAGLTSPTAMDVAPDGRVFFADQSGHVRVIDHDQLQATPFADLSAQTDGSGERGMLGLALDPDFLNNHYVYVYYTANSPASHNRLSRLTADPSNPNVMIAGSERVLFDFPDIGSAIWHMGGSIQFGPDKKIYIAVGDHQQSVMAQSLNSVFGKILRVNADGTIPADNPFHSQTTGLNQSIWAMGLRNPFTTAFQPGTGRFFINDVGEGTYEEIDDGAAGKNYGWPGTEGPFNQTDAPNYTLPFYSYRHIIGRSCVIGGAFYNPAVQQFPAQYAGKYFFADFSSGEMWTIDPSTKVVANFATGLSFADAIDLGADGTLYYSARGAGAGGQPGIGTGAIYKIQYAANLPPKVAQSPQDRLVSVGQPATFTVAASGTAPLSYQWLRDGVEIPGATSNTYTLNNTTTSDNGAVFRARVTNNFGTALSDPATLTVTTNVPPVAMINNPVDGTTYRAGDTISYSGTGTDAEDGNLPASAMTWWVDFHHHDHVHPFVAPTSGSAGGQFTIPTTGETDADVWYRIHLTVTDSIGLQHHVFRDVTPITASLTINSNLPGNVAFTLDGQTRTMPLTIQGVANLARTISVPSTVNVGGQWYAFAGWSDGGARAHTFGFPGTNTTLAATFTLLGSGVYASDLPFAATPINGWGPVERDRSNGETGAADGHTITLNGETYAKGLGVHAVATPGAPARVTFNLDGGFHRFLSDVGVDDEIVGPYGTVAFQVFADGVKVYDSGMMSWSSPTQSIDLNVDGVRQLDLVTTDAGNGNSGDHGDWAGALLVRPQDIVAPTVTDSKFIYQQPTAPGRAHGVVLTFSEDVSGLTVDDLQLVNLTTNTPVPPGSMAMTYSGGVATFTFPGFPGGILPDGNYRATLADRSVTDAAGNPLAAMTYDFFVLAADANHDRNVNFTDLLTLARNYSKAGMTFEQGDFNYDGVVNFADLLILARAYNQTLAVPPPAPAPLAAPALAVSVVADDTKGKAVFSTTRVPPKPVPKPVPARARPVAKPAHR